MASVNIVILLGNLTRDPEVKYTPKGTAVAEFGLAINHNYTTQGGEKREEVVFVDIVAYGRTAEIIGEYCKKGKPIHIEGRLKPEQWEDKQSGQKRSKMRVIANNIQLLGGRSEGGTTAPSDDDIPAQPSRAAQSATRPAQAARPRPPDPDLDAQPDDIPF